MKRNKGFTLIELLAVITILAIIISITVVMVTRTVRGSTKKSVELLKETVSEAGQKYFADNVEKTKDLFVSLKTLIDEGYLKEMKNPDTKEILTGNYLTYNGVYVKKNNKKYTFTPQLLFSGLDGVLLSSSNGLTISGTTLTNYTGSEKDIIIPNGVTSIGIRTFNNKGLKNVTIPSSVTSIGEKAFNENQLTNVVIPSSVNSIEEYAFSNNHLISVEIPSSVTSIGDYAFSENQLTNVVIPNSVNSIGGFAFSDNQLTSVEIPNGVNSIGGFAFCVNPLKSVTIPKSITSIGQRVFCYNSDLTTVTNKSGNFDWKNILPALECTSEIPKNSDDMFETGTCTTGDKTITITNS